MHIITCHGGWTRFSPNSKSIRLQWQKGWSHETGLVENCFSGTQRSFNACADLKATSHISSYFNKCSSFIWTMRCNSHSYQNCHDAPAGKIHFHQNKKQTNKGISWESSHDCKWDDQITLGPNLLESVQEQICLRFVKKKRKKERSQ